MYNFLAVSDTSFQSNTLYVPLPCNKRDKTSASVIVTLGRHTHAHTHTHKHTQTVVEPTITLKQAANKKKIGTQRSLEYGVFPPAVGRPCVGLSYAGCYKLMVF